MCLPHKDDYIMVGPRDSILKVQHHDTCTQINGEMSRSWIKRATVANPWELISTRVAGGFDMAVTPELRECLWRTLEWITEARSQPSWAHRTESVMRRQSAQWTMPTVAPTRAVSSSTPRQDPTCNAVCFSSPKLSQHIGGKHDDAEATDQVPEGYHRRVHHLQPRGLGWKREQAKHHQRRSPVLGRTMCSHLESNSSGPRSQLV